MNLPKTIFREYDIRGVYGTEFTEEIAFHIGKALAKVLTEKNLKRICIGRDNRASSLSLSQSMVEGLLQSGFNVVDAGLIPYPLTHFITTTQNFDVGINITASHNPKEYNGVKIEFKNAIPMYGKDLIGLYNKILAQDYPEAINASGVRTERNFLNPYFEFYKSRFNYKYCRKIVVNCGNGATSEAYPYILENLGVELVKMDCEFDSSFPRGVPDPEEPELIMRVAQKVKENDVDAGIIFDGDGDRFGVVDEKGQVYSSDYILLLFAKYLLSKKKDKNIIFDVKSSQILNDEILLMGGAPRMMPTGRSLFLQEMILGDAVLGAEFSGHHYNKDRHFGYDDGLFATCYLLEILDNTNKKLSELMSELPKRVSTPEIKVPCADDIKFEVMEKIKTKILSSVEPASVTTLDGVRVKTSETGWYLIRVKNTSPFLTVRAEGIDKSEVDLILNNVVRILSEFSDIDLSKVRNI